MRGCQQTRAGLDEFEMPSHITTLDAKKQGRPGSDVYRYTHLLYHDALHRDWGSVRLNIESVKAFSDTIIIARGSTRMVEF